MKVTLLSPFRIFIMDAENVSAAKVEIAARALQRTISIAFEFEQYAGGDLRAPSDKWTMYKIKHGLDPRRGHASGDLQRALYSQRLFRITRTKSTYTVTFSIDNITGPAAEYAREYQKRFAAKGLLSIKPGWLKAFARGVTAVSQNKATQALRQISGQLTNQVAGQIGDAVRAFRRPGILIVKPVRKAS